MVPSDTEGWDILRTEVSGRLGAIADGTACVGLFGIVPDAVCGAGDLSGGLLL